MLAKLKNSLTAKIFLITCLLLMVVCVLTYGFIALVMPMTYTADRNHTLTAAANQLAQQLEQSTLADCGDLLSRYAADYDARFSIRDAEGNLLKDTLTGEPRPSESDSQPAADLATVQSNSGYVSIGVEADISANIMQTIMVSFSFAKSPETYQLMVVGSMEAVNQAAAALERIWPWLVGVILLISVFTSVFYARFITRPIVQLSGISRQMCDLDFGWRCKENRTDEIGTLARSLNELAEKLSTTMAELQTANAALRSDIERERELEQQRLAFFSAASHELKTPITVIKGQLCGMLDGVGTYADRDKYLARSLTVLRQMESLVQELLIVSRMETTEAKPPMHRVDLAEIVQTCSREYADLFEQKEQTLQVTASESLWINGDLDLLSKAIRNLLANAALYSPEGADIGVTVSQQQETAVLTVENTEAHIPEDALSHLFEAFYRVDPSRNRQTGGSGLGLYLVKTILDQHGAVCRIDNTAEGVRAKVCFPLYR